jgi:hypothetical protein
MIILVAKKYFESSIKTDNPNLYFINNLDVLKTIFIGLTTDDPNKPNLPMLIIIGKFLNSSQEYSPTDDFIKEAKKRSNCIVMTVSCDIEKINLDKLEFPGRIINLNELIKKILESKKIDTLEKIIKNKNLAEFTKILHEMIPGIERKKFY